MLVRPSISNCLTSCISPSSKTRTAANYLQGTCQYMLTTYCGYSDDRKNYTIQVFNSGDDKQDNSKVVLDNDDDKEENSVEVFNNGERSFNEVDVSKKTFSVKPVPKIGDNMQYYAIEDNDKQYYAIRGNNMQYYAIEDISVDMHSYTIQGLDTDNDAIATEINEIYKYVKENTKQKYQSFRFITLPSTVEHAKKILKNIVFYYTTHILDDCEGIKENIKKNPVTSYCEAVINEDDYHTFFLSIFNREIDVYK